MSLLTARSLRMAGGGRGGGGGEARQAATRIARAPQTPIATRAYDWTKGGFGGRAVAQQQRQQDQQQQDKQQGDDAAGGGSGGGGGAESDGRSATARPPPRPPPFAGRRFAASEDAAATERLVGIVSAALADDPVTLAYAVPGRERRYCEAALQAGLLTDSVGRDRRLWLSQCGRAAAVAYLCSGAGGVRAGAGAAAAAAGGGRTAAAEEAPPAPPPLPLWAGAQRAALTAAALTSLRPGAPARACARAATALARVRGAYCAAVERSVGDTGGRARVAHVSVLAVLPSAQGRGLGTELLRGLLRELLAEPVAESAGNGPAAFAASHAYVEASSARSAALYRRLGFRDVARVGAGGDVLTTSAAAGGGGGGREGGGEGEGGDDAPTFIMSAEVKGAFRDWLTGADEG